MYQSTNYQSSRRNTGQYKPFIFPADVDSSKLRLLPRLRYTMRRLHYSYTTEKHYVAWVKRFIYFHKKKHPLEVGEEGIKNFLRASLPRARKTATA